MTPIARFAAPAGAPPHPCTRDPALDRLGRLAARSLGVPFALVAPGDPSAGPRGVAAAAGLEQALELAPVPALCAEASEHGSVAVADIRHEAEDRRGAAVAQLGLVAFLGIPLVGEGEQGDGAVLVADRVPRAWDEADLDALRDIAAAAAAELRRRRDTEQVRLSERRLADAQALGRMGSWEWDPRTGRVSASAELLRIFGVEAGEGLPDPAAFMARIHPDDRARLDRITFGAHTGGPEHYSTECRLVRPDGELRWIRIRGEIERGDDGMALRSSGIAQDVTDRHRAEQRIRHNALHHPLTGLPNRALFLDRLRHALAEARLRGGTVVVTAIDIDRFRRVNEQHGLDGGDAVLRAMAGRLTRVVPASDTVAHLGEDMFAVISEDLAGERGAVALAARLGRTVERPVELAAAPVRVTASVGVALADGGAASPEDLIRDAEAAALRAGERGGGTWEVFDPALRARLRERIEVEQELRRGIERGELQVHYQPVLRGDGGLLVGYEALVRWAHPDRGLLAPGAFLAVAEESGLAVSLGARVLEMACRQAVAWSDADAAWDAVGVGVNVSARQVDDPAFPTEVAAVLADTGIRPARLRLELTESDLMRSPDPEGTVEALKALGVRVILDDFGTGWSSLSHLRRFAVDGLKIDRSFVAGVDREVQSARIVEAIVAMARALDLTVVAEGVETEDELAKLASLGCHMVQGYLLERPAPATALRTDWPVAR